jgi:hypothetical protein
MAFDIEGVTPAGGEEERVKAAIAELEKDPHAAHDITVRLTLHIHREYPKHVKVGEDKEGNPITKIVNSAEEEAEVS